MNTLVVFAIVIAAAVADPDPHGELVAVQQDSLGNYKYSINGLARVEQHAIPAAVSGYSYIDPYPVLRKVPYTIAEQSVSIPVTVEAAPTISVARTEHLPILRNVELTHPVIKELEIPQVSLVKSSVVDVVPVATPSLLRVSELPESPAILELESKQFAAHVARHNSHFI